MKKILFLILTFNLVLFPSLTWASPGPLDQYGGHACKKDCAIYGLENGEYHFHAIPNSPSYLSGETKSSVIDLLFYMPKPRQEETTKNPVSIVSDEPNTLTENIIYDNQLCQGAEIFANGRYAQGPKVRISPVCVERDINVLKNTNLNPLTDYYKGLPNENPEITKVYHVKILGDGKAVFTDMPEIAELKGLIVQGVSDSALFYINPNDENLALRPITAEKAIQLKGVNYKLGIVYFDDSIIYSYPIARPLL